MEMKLTLLTFISSFVFTASTGTWIKTDGTVLEVPCPKVYEGHRQRLPSGCTNIKAGVWLQTDKYREMEVTIAKAKADEHNRQREIALLKTRISKLESQLILCTAVPECPACPNHYFRNTTMGAIIGSTITLGGCAVWNLSK
jgi:hypothetical protein